MRDHLTEATSAALAASGPKLTATGAATGIIGWLMSSDPIGLGGLLCAVIGLAVTVYYQRERAAQWREIHALKIARLKAGLPDPDDE